MPLRGHQPPSDARMVGELSRRVAVLEREKNPVVSAATVPFYTAVATLSATRSLLGYWRLGEAASPFADTSGFSPPAPAVTEGAGTAVTTHVTGALPAAADDGAVLLNGGQYLHAPEPTVPRRFNFGNSADMTAACWIKPSTNATSDNTGVLGTWNDGGFAGFGWEIFVQAPSLQVKWSRSDSGGTVTVNGPNLVAGQWAFITATWSSTLGQKLYVNGALAAANASTSASSLPTFNTGLYFGLEQVLGKLFKGAMDEVSVWGAALTASEVATLASSGGLASASSSTVAVTGNYTASSADDVILATGTITVTLPTAVGIAGKRITVKNVGVGTITVARTSAQTIDATAADVSMATAKQAREFASDGTGWQITAAYL